MTTYRRITIFDTTLRDGEQCPGASLNPQEKLEIAKQLARLKVDVIEGGFPIASPGDASAVKMIARIVKGPTIAAQITEGSDQPRLSCTARALPTTPARVANSGSAT